MQRWLIATGAVLILLGIVWPWLARLGLGRLPGDIHIERDGFGFHFPIVTCLVVSVVISLIVWILRR